jgi:hypothetical protein
MFDFHHVLKPLLYSEQAVALMKVHPKASPRYTRTGLVAVLCDDKLWRFRVSNLVHCLPHAVNSEQLSVPPHNS